MSSPAELRPKRNERDDLSVRQVEPVCPEYNWFLHQAVGTEFRWGGRENWGESQWIEYASNPELETWVGYLSGTPFGYFELEKLEDNSARIHCFGLMRRFFGQGLGGHLLTVAVERGWARDVGRVWLSTCSHDHTHALLNYQARGFRIVEERTSSANGNRSPVIFTSGVPLSAVATTHGTRTD